MNAQPRPIRRKPAKRPAIRTVHVLLEDGDFAGWEATARADFPARLLSDLQSGNIGRIIGVLDAIVLDHNFPDEKDQLATSMGDVDPYDGLLEVAGGIFDAIGKLPNR
jgi:hypothetical protein